MFKEKNLVGSVLVLWYSLSIYSAYLSHEADYFEQYAFVLLGMMILISPRIRSSVVFTVLSAVTGFVCLLISETNAFLILPTLFVMSLMRILERPVQSDQLIHKRRLCKEMAFLFLVNFPGLIYCVAAGLVLVPESRVTKQLEIIRSHSNHFERLDEIGEYFYGGSRMPESYTQVLEFKVWNWQMKLYLVLIILTVTAALLFVRQQKKAVGYMVSVISALICIYCLNFIALILVNDDKPNGLRMSYAVCSVRNKWGSFEVIEDADL